VEIKFFRSVSLKGLYVEDLHHDTLLYANDLTIRITQFDNKTRNLSIGQVKLSNADFFLIRYRSENHDNIKFLTDYFSSKDTLAPDTTHTKKWKITFDQLQLANVHFRHDVEKDTVKPLGVDFAHLDVKNISGEFNHIHVINDSIFTAVNGLRFKDRSGFELTEFSGDTKVSSEGLRIKGLVIKSPFTNIHTDLAFKYDSFSDFDDFLRKVKWNSNFNSSTVSFNDIAYFATDLWGVNRQLIIDGECKGTVAKFICKNVTIRFGSGTYFKGNIGLTGLPNIEETYFDVQGDEIVTTKKDVETIPVAPFDSDNHVRLPDNIATLGKVVFKGRFSGFYNDFVAFGNVSTALGYISSDINLKYDRKLKIELYSGHLIATKFNVGKFENVPELGLVSLNANVTGSGLKLDKAEAKMKGVISLLQFKNYSYQSINIDGTLSKKLFAGSLAIAEPNVDLLFKGQINFQGQLPQYNFTADINHLHVDTLNLLHLPGEAEVSSHVFIDLTGNKLDNFAGQVQINDFNYKADQRLYHINNITLNSEIKGETKNIEGSAAHSFSDSSSFHLIHISSDFLDAEFKGQFDFKNLGNAFTQILPEYFPSLLPECKRVSTAQDFRFNINLKNLSLITERFLPAWTIAPNSTVNGSFNSIQNYFEATVWSPNVRLNSIILTNEELNLTTNKNSIKLSSTADRVYLSDSFFIADPIVYADGAKDNVTFQLKFADSIIYDNRGSLRGNLVFLSPKKFNLNFQDVSIYLDKMPWTINKENEVIIDSSTIAFNHFNFLSASEGVALQGVISKSPDEKLTLSFSDFTLAHFNSLLRTSEITVGGVLTGTAILKGVYAQANVISDLTIHGLSFNGDTLGNAAINSTYDDEKKIVHLSVNVLNNEVKTITLNGDYYTGRKQDNLDFKIQFQNFYISAYERYVNSLVSDLRGKISADLSLKGTFAQPDFEGYIDFSKSGCRVNYLNTNYSINDRAWIKENQFQFKNFTLRDDKGNIAEVNGTVTHDYFKNFRLDLRLEASKFHVLNTTLVENDVYYGTAFGSGYASFTGPTNNINMDIQMKSVKGTEIHLPLSNASEISRGEFITFINRKDTTRKQHYQTKVVTTGINLNLRMELTTDANIELIFDEKIGDKISGTGTGNLELALNPAGEFHMYGNYIIERGDYLFTLQNVINKHFDIENGGTISWKGDPLDADVNISASYRNSTSTLYKLMADSTYRRRLNYEVVLRLTNKLMNPTINYSINILELDAAAESQVRSKLNSEAEVSKQVFGLLVLNQFLPLSTGNDNTIDARSGASSSGAELLSDQLSNWTSQLIKNFTLGVNYKTKDSYGPNEYSLIIAKNLLNDRLLIEGNVGVATDQNASNVIGDFNLEYMMSDNGRLKLKAFNKSNINNLVYYNAPYTQGVGFMYHREFNKLRDLFNKIKKEPKKEGAIGSKP